MTPKISVIIPVFNAVPRLPAAIGSIRAQNYPNIEIIVVDDGSEAPAGDAVRALGEDIVFIRQENGGPASARNRGLSAATGEWIAFLDADDLWPADKFAVQCPELSSDAGWDIVLGRIQYITENGAAFAMPHLDARDNSISHVHLGSMLCRRSAFDRIGFFDIGMRYSEDQDWFLRAREAGLKITVLDHVTLLYHQHESNMTRGRNLTQLGVLSALRKSLQRRRSSGQPAAELTPWSSHFQNKFTNPLVSAIIPAHNGVKYLAEAIHSIVRQDYHPIEIIVVDDGSTDGTAAVAQGFPQVIYVRQPNRGPGAARNRGIAEAKGEFLAFLDQDDLWQPGKTRAQVRYLLDHPKSHYVVTDHSRFLQAGVDRPSWLRQDNLERDLGGYEPGSLMARRSVFELAGLFDESLFAGSDVDWFFRAKDARLAMGRIEEPLLLRRFHTDNQSSQVSKLHRDLVAVARSSIQRQRGTP